MSGRDFIAHHVHGIDTSGIRKVFDLGATLPDPINFSIGQPDYPVPQGVKRSMIRAIESDQNGYTVTRGLPELRESIAASLRREFDWNPDVFITSGVSGGLFLVLSACVNPGEEVLIGDPSFVSYRHLVRMTHGVPRLVRLYDDFQLHPERFAAAATPKTKMIVTGSPGNPTGIVFKEADVAALADLARKRDLLIVSDEIYHTLSYDGPVCSPARFAPERTIVLRGFGKSHAMTGLRIAYAAGPTEIITEMAKLQQYTYVCAPHPAQHGALTAMDTDTSAQLAAYRAKRDLVCRELEGAFDFQRPSGGFYLFPKAPPRFETASAFVAEAIRHNVLVIPGEVFGTQDTHFRISYAVPDAKIREGCGLLRSLAR